jgi:type I restriction enzyme S subunit
MKKEKGGTSLSRFRPYPVYKDSGVEWLGKIPAHWRLLASRRSIGRIEQGWSPVAEERLAGLDEWAVIKLSAVNKGTFVPDEHKALPADLAPDTRYEIHEGDFLLTRANTPDLVADVCIARGVRPKLMLCDLVYRLQLRSDRVSPTFLVYWLLSRVGRYQIEVDARGSSQSMVKVSQGHILAWKLILPPHDEQRAIAAFLDRETARIDALVAKKELLIELLQEKRTALINRAVTKGLDPNVPMKDSGVEWLGEIPAHWEVKPLKAISALQTGLTLGKKFDGRSLVARPYLRVANVQDGYLDLDDIADVELPGYDLVRYELRTGDVLMTEGGDFDKLGRGHVWEGQVAGCLHQNHIFAVRPRRHVLNPYFLAHAMSSGYGRAYFTATSKQSTNLASTNSTKLGNLPVPLPGLAEQHGIVLSIGQDTKRADALIAKVRDAIERLKELRTALISAAVTGKIDVREASRAAQNARGA